MTKIVIVGATSTIAEACAELWSQANNELVLVGRDIEKLEILKNHLLIKSSNAIITTLRLDFTDETSINQEITKITSVDVALMAHGELTDQEQAQTNAEQLTKSVMVNATSAAVFLEAFANQMANRKTGTLAVIGSVAGDRGRASNYIYGAAKGFIERYTQGLRTRFSGTDVKVILFKLGPTKTRMTSSMNQRGFADPKAVATAMVQIIGKGKSGSFYIPIKWLIIMTIVKLLPTSVLAKLNL